MRDLIKAQRCRDCGVQFHLSPQEGVCVDCSVDAMTAEYGGGYTTITLSNDTWKTLENFLLYHLEPMPTWHEPDEEELAAMGRLRKVLTSMLMESSTGQRGGQDG